MTMLYTVEGLTKLGRDPLALMAKEIGLEPAWIRRFGHLRKETYRTAILEFQRLAGETQSIPSRYVRQRDAIVLFFSFRERLEAPSESLFQEHGFRIVLVKDLVPVSMPRPQKRGVPEAIVPGLQVATVFNGTFLLEVDEPVTRLIFRGEPRYEAVDDPKTALAYVLHHFGAELGESLGYLRLHRVLDSLSEHTYATPELMLRYLQMLSFLGHVKLHPMGETAARNLSMEQVEWEGVHYGHLQVMDLGEQPEMPEGADHASEWQGKPPTL